MIRRLMLLNLLLMGLCALVGMRLRAQWEEARVRETRTLSTKVAPQKYPPLARYPVNQPVLAMSYIDVAQKMLLSKDRSPVVVLDPPKPVEKPPMPPLPLAFGLMMFNNPGIIMSEKAGAPQKTYHVGENIGAFKLLAFDNANVTLEWEGQKIERRLEDLVDRNAIAAAAAANLPAVGAQSAPVNVPPPAQVKTEALGPGPELAGGYRACLPNDSTPNGTVVNGVRKVTRQTPFGNSCGWEPVR